MIPGDVYVRQMLARHHRVALADSGVAGRRPHRTASRREADAGRIARLRLLVLRLRPAHGGS